ncbi:hypothetical protein MKX03_033408 [Papaver bracteatum]|nr:hypothetical protein MKX03_033408 [Papaver bracteatum]
MATAKTLSLVGVLLFTSILIHSMNVNASMHACLVMAGRGETYLAHGTDWLPWTSASCTGDLMRWRYSPTDDVHGDCIDWCQEFGDTVGCAQMNEDETSKIYCACYQWCE